MLKKRGGGGILYILQHCWSPGWPSPRDSTPNEVRRRLTGNQAVWMDEGQRTHRRICGQTTEFCFPGSERRGSGWRRGERREGRVRQHPPTTISTPQINGPQPHDLAVDRKGRKLRDNSKKPNNAYSISYTDTPRCMLGKCTSCTDQSQG